MDNNYFVFLLNTILILIQVVILCMRTLNMQNQAPIVILGLMAFLLNFACLCIVFKKFLF